MNRFNIKKIIALASLFVFGIVFFYIVSFIVFLYTPALGTHQEVVINIKQGMVFSQIVSELKEQGLINDTKKFYILAKLRNTYSKVRAGELRFYQDMTPLEIMDILVNGVPVTYSFTVPEGYNLYQVADVLKSKGIIDSEEEFISVAKDKNFLREIGIFAETAEGYLYPDTYNVPKGLDARQVIKIMHKGFESVFKKNYLARAKELGFSEYEILTLASIIEKETGVPEERKLISSVFHNRIRKRMKLQSDPTTIYGIWEDFKGNLKREHLKQYTPYNTYKIYGLPKGPIANPGEAAIKAALFPVKSGYLYFVSRNDGTHVFSESYADHERAVHRFQKNRAARNGKSWRDYSNRQKIN